MPLSQGLLPEFDHEMATTRKVLERVPQEKWAWKPHQKSMPFGRLASHLAELAGWAETTLSSEELDLAPPGAPQYQPFTASSRDETLKVFDENVKKTRAAIAAASDSAWMAPWTLKAGSQQFFTLPRVAAVRGMIFNHMIHHRGQLSVYLRLNDVPVPSMYGPSADEQPM